MTTHAESDRLRALRSTELLDTPPEHAFDRMTRLAAGLLGVPVALVSLVDSKRQFFKSAVGLGEPWRTRRETPLTHSFCQYVTRDRSTLVVADAREHPMLLDNLAITELDVVAYAGVPLFVADEAVGAFCVIDTRPREWSARELELLQDLAECVISELELRRAVHSAAKKQALTVALLEGLGDAVLAVDAEHNFMLVNRAARAIFSERAEVGLPMPDDWPAVHRSRKSDGAMLEAGEGALARGMRGLGTDRLTFALQKPGAAEAVWVEVTGRPVKDASGKVLAAVAVYRDVTLRTREADRYRALAGNIPHGAVVLFDTELRCVGLDGEFVRAERIEPNALVGKPMDALAGMLDPDGLGSTGALYRSTLAGESSLKTILFRSRSLELRTVPVRDAFGRVTEGLVLALDRTAEKNVEDALRRSQQLYQAMVRHLPDVGLFMVNPALHYELAEGAAVDEILRRRGLVTLVGLTVAQATSPSNLVAATELFQRALRGEKSRLEMQRDGQTFDLHAVPVYDGERISHALMFLYDVTERRRQAAELERTCALLVRERALFDATLAHIEDGVELLDAERRILLANASYAAMFDLPLERLEGLGVAQFASHLATRVESPESTLERMLHETPEPTQEFVLSRPRRRVLRRTWTPVKLLAQDGFLVTWHDITAERDSIEERERQLMLDALTGIANRRAGEAALSREYARMHRAGAPLSLALFDVDHFKRVNDEFGHGAGDEVLRAVASALAACARGTDTVARWGGEEFLAVLPVSLEGARVFCERGRSAVESLALAEHARVTLSAGVVQLRPDESPHEALERADARLYEAKREGRNRVRA